VASAVVHALSPVRFPLLVRAPRQKWHSLAALLIGLAVPFQLEWFGIIYASEILLALVACWALATNLGNGAFWRRPFTILVATLGVTMLAYMVTDLGLETEFQNLARGWAVTSSACISFAAGIRSTS
jgi:hypothetical protein